MKWQSHKTKATPWIREVNKESRESNKIEDKGGRIACLVAADGMGPHTIGPKSLFLRVKRYKAKASASVEFLIEHNNCALHLENQKP